MRRRDLIRDLIRYQIRDGIRAYIRDYVRAWIHDSAMIGDPRDWITLDP